ncbi:MAG TPA: hypothetical protein VGC97_06975 [Pyrinomonadaceae bacterium]|jgi:uncharacterized protein (TIGR02646 family)
MIKIERLPSPEILVERFAGLTVAYLSNPNRKVFDARTGLYREIKRILMLMTQEHCSFCDGFPVANTGDAIEHFKPSSDTNFRHLAYDWENLYYCCTKCNSSKGIRFDENLLRPDDIEYFFENFFSYNAKEAKLEPAFDISEEDRERAKKTIQLYNLNRTENKTERRRMIKNFLKEKHERDDFPFRYIIDLELI